MNHDDIKYAISPGTCPFAEVPPRSAGCLETLRFDPAVNSYADILVQVDAASRPQNEPLNAPTYDEILQEMMHAEKLEECAEETEPEALTAEFKSSTRIEWSDIEELWSDIEELCHESNKTGCAQGDNKGDGGEPEEPSVGCVAPRPPDGCHWMWRNGCHWMWRRRSTVMAAALAVTGVAAAAVAVKLTRETPQTLAWNLLPLWALHRPSPPIASR